jgi:hypothetical protein
MEVSSWNFWLWFGIKIWYSKRIKIEILRYLKTPKVVCLTSFVTSKKSVDRTFFQTGEIIWRNIFLIVQFLLPCFNSIRDDSIGLNLLGLQWKTRFWNFQTEIMFSQRRGEMTKKSSWSSRFKNFTGPHFSPIPRKLRVRKISSACQRDRHITKFT